MVSCNWCPQRLGNSATATDCKLILIDKTCSEMNSIEITISKLIYSLLNWQFSGNDAYFWIFTIRRAAQFYTIFMTSLCKFSLFEFCLKRLLWTQWLTSLTITLICQTWYTMTQWHLLTPELSWAWLVTSRMGSVVVSMSYNESMDYVIIRILNWIILQECQTRSWLILAMEFDN